VDETTFDLTIVPVPGVSLPEAEAAMDQVIAGFLETGVDADQLVRIKMQMRAAQIYARDDVSGLANRYGAALATGLTVADVLAWPEILQAVTEDDVMQAARDVFQDRNSVTGYLTGNDAEATPEVTQ
jgi:zinc protease